MYELVCRVGKALAYPPIKYFGGQPYLLFSVINPLPYCLSKYVKSFFNFFRKDNKIVLRENEKELAPRMLKSNILYCPMEINYKKYYSNFLEQDARVAGAEAENEFKKYSEKLAKLLGIPKEMTFCSTLNDRLSSFIKSHLQTTDVKVIKINELFAAAKS